MALINNFIDNDHNEYVNAYHKVYMVNYSQTEVDIFVAVYETEEARINGENPIEIRKFKTTQQEYLNNKNVVEQSYEQLKLIDEYSEALDVL